MQQENLEVKASPNAFHLGDWRIEPSLNRLSRDGEEVQVELKLMELLVYLAGREGEVASKIEIIDAVWRTEFIAENTLTHSIADLRRALGDDARKPAYIQTIPKRGYRVVAPITGFEQSDLRPSVGVGALKLITPDREYSLIEGVNVVGRGETATVRLDSSRASREHARITVAAGRAVIEDLGSKNGTFLEGARLESRTELKHGDTIRIGRNQALLRFAVASEATLTELDD